MIESCKWLALLGKAVNSMDRIMFTKNNDNGNKKWTDDIPWADVVERGLGKFNTDRIYYKQDEQD